MCACRVHAHRPCRMGSRRGGGHVRVCMYVCMRTVHVGRVVEGEVRLLQPGGDEEGAAASTGGAQVLDRRLDGDVVHEGRP